MNRTVTIALVVAACGGSPKPATAPANHVENKDEMANAPPELAKFHAVLAPRWHAAKGADRMASTCGAIGEFSSAADGIGKATPSPKVNASSWAQEAKELGEAVAALKAKCEAKDAAGFETAFANVHQEFHELLELTSAEHHEEPHEEHHEDSGY